MGYQGRWCRDRHREERRHWGAGPQARGQNGSRIGCGRIGRRSCRGSSDIVRNRRFSNFRLSEGFSKAGGIDVVFWRNSGLFLDMVDSGVWCLGSGFWVPPERANPPFTIHHSPLAGSAVLQFPMSRAETWKTQQTYDLMIRSARPEARLCDPTPGFASEPMGSAVQDGRAGAAAPLLPPIFSGRRERPMKPGG